MLLTNAKANHLIPMVELRFPAMQSGHGAHATTLPMQELVQPDRPINPPNRAHLLEPGGGRGTRPVRITAASARDHRPGRLEWTRAMTPLLPTSTLGTVWRAWQQAWAAVCGAGLIVIVASGLAMGWGAVVGRLTTTGTGWEASGPRPILVAASVADPRHDDPPAPTGASLAAVFDGRYNDPTGAPPWWPAGSTRRHVVDRWYTEPAAATTNGAGRGGFRAPDLPNSAAPNELQLFGRSSPAPPR